MRPQRRKGRGQPQNYVGSRGVRKGLWEGAILELGV